MEVQVLIALDFSLSLDLISHEKEGVKGFDGDTEVIGACRAPGDSLNLRENATANQELALAA